MPNEVELLPASHVSLNPNPFCHTEKPVGKTGIPSHRVGGTDLLKRSEDGQREAFCRSGICNLSGFQSGIKGTGKYEAWSPSKENGTDHLGP